MSKGAQIAVGALGVALLLGWFSWSQLETGATYQYYQTLDEFLAADAGGRGESLRLHGFVAEGSIVRDVDGKQVRFSVQNDPPHAGGAGGADGAARKLAVLYHSLETPDLFQDGAEVVVEGRLDGAGSDAVFVAHNVLAKCPSKFEAQEPGSTQL